MEFIFLTTSDEAEPYLHSMVSLLNANLSYGLSNEEELKNILTAGSIHIALKDGILLGLATIKRTDTSTELGHLVVSPDYRGTGIGSSLLDLSLSTLPANTDIFAEAWVKPTGWDAESLFASRGFTLESLYPDYWKQDCHSTSFCPFYTGTCNCSCKVVRRCKTL